MSVTIKLEQFEGPYDLLLQLIRKKELEITEVALSKVTKQYLSYVDELENKKPEELSDFLVVAAKLLLLKSGKLIPKFSQEEEVEEENLEEHLKIYRKFKKASEDIKDLWEQDNMSFFRKESENKLNEFVEPDNLTLDKMRNNMHSLIEELELPTPPPQTKVDETISLKRKVDHVRNCLNSRNKLNFNEVVEDKKNKTEVIVGFLALLELVKQDQVSLSQQKLFDNILVQKS